MSWPLLVLDWSRYQMPRPGARYVFVSRHASVASDIAVLGSAVVGNAVVRTVVGGVLAGGTIVHGTAVGDTVLGDSGLLSVKLIRLETLKACTRLPVARCSDGARIWQSASCRQLMQWRNV
jgi:hypothetical protein